MRSASFHGTRLREADRTGALDPAHVALAGTIVSFERALAIAAALGPDVRPG